MMKDQVSITKGTQCRVTDSEKLSELLSTSHFFCLRVLMLHKITFLCWRVVDEKVQG